MSADVENRLSFGLDAVAYRDYRPRYPDALLDYLAGLVATRGHALDCATGNGQAAVGLAARFDRVSAFDPDEAQLAVAIAAPNVEYRVASAEALPWPDSSFDLITVAQGAHWFDLPVFYEEAKRVAKAGAVIAIWGYSYSCVEPQIDSIVRELLLEPIEPHWANGNRVVQDHYRTIPFPFDEFEWPVFTSTRQWTRTEYLRYLATWSASRKYREKTGHDPFPELAARLEPHWADDRQLEVGFSFPGRVGRIGQPASPCNP